MLLNFSFDHSSYETSLLETTSVNSRFFALQATDQDSGENAQISYEIVDGNGAQKFGVFPDGFLYVKTPLDREEQDFFSLTVMSRDNGVPQRSSTVSVVIFLVSITFNYFAFIIDKCIEVNLPYIEYRT